MSLTMQQQLAVCLDKFRRNELTEQDLQEVISAADAPRKCQDLLYLQASSTAVTARVLGMSLLEAGQLSDGPADPAQWPYQTVLDAIKDGWRVIQFPNLALLLDETRAYALGCEFILER